MANLIHTPSRTELDAFLEHTVARSPGSGRLIFALDATASREATWDMACRLQAEMFTAAAGLEMQLIYFRGNGECRASRWCTEPAQLAELMTRISCVMGFTQIEKILRHAQREHTKFAIAGIVFIGDAFEENIDPVGGAAHKLGVPAFMFLEGSDAGAEKAFREIVRITRGAFARFDAGAADQLRDLLKAVAAYAAGGVAALEGKPGATLLLAQLKK